MLEEVTCQQSLLRNALEAGYIFVLDSIEFRRFEDDLISDGCPPILRRCRRDEHAEICGFAEAYPDVVC